MMMQFTFMQGAELKDLITKDHVKAGGKLERVQYMDKQEVQQLNQQ